MVYRVGLENRSTARYRGFESLSLRTRNESARNSGRFSFQGPPYLRHTTPPGRMEQPPQSQIVACCASLRAVAFSRAGSCS